MTAPEREPLRVAGEPPARNPKAVANLRTYLDRLRTTLRWLTGLNITLFAAEVAYFARMKNSGASISWLLFASGGALMLGALTALSGAVQEKQREVNPAEEQNELEAILERKRRKRNISISSIAVALVLFTASLWW